MNLNTSRNPDVLQTVPKRGDSAFRTEYDLQQKIPLLSATCGSLRRIGTSVYDGGRAISSCRDGGVRVLAEAVPGGCFEGRARGVHDEHLRRNHNDQ